MKYHITALIIFYSFSASCQVKTWTGNFGDNMWNSALNWSPIGIPGSTNRVKILNELDTVIIPSGYTATIKDMVNLGSFKVSVNAELTLANSDTIALVSKNLFNNKGKITIKNVTEDGTYLIGNFNNYGEILIESNIGGIGLSAPSGFENHSTGEITISSYGSTGLYGTGFVNYGKITVLPGQGTIGVHFNYFNTIGACGEIRVQNKIKIEANCTLTNNGLLHQDWDGYNDFTFGHVLNNNGIIQDNYHALTNETGLTQEGIIIQPYEDEVYEDIEVYNVIDIADSLSGYDISNIYTNKALTISAGSFDVMNNIWIPNNNAIGDSTFFISVEDLMEGCIDTLKILLEHPVVETNLWIGGVGIWNDDTNWSKDHTPLSTETVIISSTTDSVNLFSLFGTSVQQVILYGKLYNGPNSSLSVLGQTEANFRLIGGKFYNHGLCNVENGYYGIYTDSAAVVINSGSLLMDNNGYRSVLVRSECVFENKPSGLLSCDNSQECIQVYSNGIFLNSGEIEISNMDESGLSNGGECTLGGNILIDNCDVGLNIDKFTSIDSSASIVIKNCLSYGVDIDGLTNLGFEIKGTLTIDSVLNGTGLANTTAITVSGNGTLKITNCANGISNSGGGLGGEATLTISTSDSVVISDIAGTGIKGYSTSIFVSDSSTVIITETGSTGISLSGSDGGIFYPTIYGTLENYGIIKVQNTTDNSLNVSSYGILNNFDCGNLVLGGPLTLTGEFSNYGYFNYESSDVSSISELIINEGIIEDGIDVLDSTTVDNQHLLMRLIDESYSEGDTVINVFDYGDGYNGEGLLDTFYIDSLFNTPGGIFSGNTLILLDASAGKSVLYTKDGEVCNQSFALNFTNEILPLCGSITWTGGTGIWNESQNWSKLQVPTSCDSVYIVNATDSITIDNFDSIYIARLSNNGNIFQKANSQIQIINNEGIGILNNGLISSNGNIVISTLPSNYGIKNQGGTILNAAQGVMTFTNGGLLIAQYGSSEFNNEGLVETGFIDQPSKIYIGPLAIFHNNGAGILNVR